MQVQVADLLAAARFYGHVIGLDLSCEPHRRDGNEALLGAVSDEIIDAIDVLGSSELVTATIAAYRQAGVQVPVVSP